MSTSAAQILVGRSDFRSLRQAGALYVDKTAFVSEVLRANAEVLLFPRPRRFGKTTNLTTLRWFLERSSEDRWNLFEGLAVARDAAARAHFQRYPIIYMTFKDVKALAWEDCRAALGRVLAGAFADHGYLLDDGTLSSAAAASFTAVLEGRAPNAELWSALRELSQHLARRHGEKVVILVDEYDTPIHAAFTHGYEERVIEFFRNLLSGGLKDNPNLFKGVLTGILRVGKESIFSGLNNLAVYSILRPEFASSFGFTDEEVRRLATDLDGPALMDEIRSWYDGYRFGDEVIYNPWSVMNFLASQDKRFRPYWTASGSNDLLERLLFRQGMGLRGELEVLLGGGAIEKPVEEDLVLRRLEQSPEAVWSFLLFTGYLKPVGVRMDERGTTASLAVTNREVMLDFEHMVRSFMSLQTGGEVDRLLKALLAGDDRTFEQHLGRFLAGSFSYHDPAGRTPERVYQAFVLGLLVNLRPRWEVRSNPESGFGRCDLLVSPRAAGEPGAVLELKTLDVERGETVERALEAALGQIRERRYATALEERGARPIHEIAVVFDGKRVWVRRAG